MRHTVVAMMLAASLSSLPLMSGAQALDKCAQTEEWFNQAIGARKAGLEKSDALTALRPAMGRKPADELVNFVWSMPAEYLTPEVAAAARAQCEKL
jgi:type II secretory pathway component PulJ